MQVDLYIYIARLLQLFEYLARSREFDADELTRVHHFRIPSIPTRCASTSHSLSRLRRAKDIGINDLGRRYQLVSHHPSTSRGTWRSLHLSSLLSVGPSLPAARDARARVFRGTLSPSRSPEARRERARAHGRSNLLNSQRLIRIESGEFRVELSNSLDILTII